MRVAQNNNDRPDTVYAVLAAVVLVGLMGRRAGQRRSDTPTPPSAVNVEPGPRSRPYCATLPEEVRLAGGAG